MASAPDSRFSVMCVDDNAELVDALERRLELEADFGAFLRVGELTDAFERIRATQPTVVILDIDLPNGIDALALLAQVASEVTATRVIIFTGHPTGQLITNCMALGAWGFVTKGTTAERVIGAIRAVLRGEAVIELDD